MLFDLQGKRRRAVQATYLILAVLMGGGLVLFGVGSGSISGGLFDALTGKNSGGGGGGNSAITKRINADQRALRGNPKNANVLADLIRAHYQLAGADEDQTTGQFGSTGKAELRKAGTAWEQYVQAVPKPDPSLASLMLNAYGTIGLNDASKATDVAALVAAAQPSPAAYLRVAQYAQQAGRTAVADRAARKAVDLAPKKQKKLVQQQVAAIKASSAAGGATTPGSG